MQVVEYEDALDHLVLEEPLDELAIDIDGLAEDVDDAAQGLSVELDEMRNEFFGLPQHHGIVQPLQVAE